MSLKAKLATTIAALCMVICLLTVGVFAASTATVNLKGTVKFEATDVSVTISGSAKGTGGKYENDAAERVIETIEEYSIDANDDSKATNNDFSNLDLSFAHKNETITIVINVTNNNEQRVVNSAFTPTLAGTALTETETEIKVTEEGQLTAETTNVLAKYTVTGLTDGAIPMGETAVYTITLRIKEKNNSVPDSILEGVLELTDPSVQ